MVPAGAIHGKGAADGAVDPEAIAGLGPGGGVDGANLDQGHSSLGSGGAESEECA